MVEIFQGIVKPIWEILGQFPMPWRIILEIIPILLITPWLLQRVIPKFIYFALYLILIISENLIKFVVLPEALMSQAFRKRGKNVPQIIYFFGDIFRTIIGFIFNLEEKTKLWKERIIKKPFSWNLKWLIMTAIILPLIWYSRPILGSTAIGGMVDNSISWWTSLEGWLVSGSWKSRDITKITPEQFILNYFSDINSRNLSNAWKSLTPKFQNNKRLMPDGYTSYQEWWGNSVQKVKIISINTQGQTFDSAKVRVTWSYLGNGEVDFSSETTFTLYLILDINSGKWLIDESDS